MTVVALETPTDTSDVHLPSEDVEGCSMDDYISPREIASLDDIIKIPPKKSSLLQLKKVVIYWFEVLILL